jgi:hypothetical protein
MGLHLYSKERAFVEQKELFLATALRMLGADRLENLPDPTDRLAAPLPPVVIDDYRQLDSKSISAIASAYWGENGAALFIVLNPSAPGHKSHPLLEIAEQLSDVLPLRFPVDHPIKGHPEAASRFGTSDGTLKIYDLETKDSKIGYREQAETSEQFDAHNDGLGYAGAVEAFILYADSAPLWGGYTYFQNVISLCLGLARKDPGVHVAVLAGCHNGTATTRERRNQSYDTRALHERTKHPAGVPSCGNGRVQDLLARRLSAIGPRGRILE